MRLIVFASFSILLTGKVYGQYCMSGGPSSNADSEVESVQLTGTSGAINYTGCPGTLGVRDLTASTSVTLTAGQNYTVTVDFGTCGGNYFGAGQAWIDFNGDMLFDASEALGSWSGTPPANPVPMNFTVPAGALSGTTRMRVTQQEAGSLPLDPCASFTWGSVTDFSVIITGGVDCSAYDGDTKEDAIPVPSVPYTTTGNTSYCYYNQNLVYNSPDIYYLLLPTPQMSQIHVSLCNSAFDTFLSVVDPQGNVLAYNDDGSCGSASECTVNAALSDSMYIIIEGWGTNSGDFTLNITSSYVGLDEGQASSFNVFPNPANDEFVLGDLNGYMVLRDLNGKVVREGTVAKNEKIAVSELPGGVYLVELTTEDRVFTAKLMKK
jgi:hypothetical protein